MNEARQPAGARPAAWTARSALLSLWLVIALGFLGGARFFFPNDTLATQSSPADEARAALPERCRVAHAGANGAQGATCPYAGAGAR